MHSRKQTYDLGDLIREGGVPHSVVAQMLDDLAAIDRFVDAEHMPDLRGGAVARLLWGALYKKLGCRPGTLRISEAEMAALIGSDGSRALRGSKDSDGPLDRLEKIRAVEKGPGGRWYVASPEEVGDPRPRAKRMGDQTPPFEAMRDLDTEPDAVGGTPEQTGGFRRETPDATHGGRGGEFLGASQEGKKNNPPPPPHSESDRSASGGFPAETPVYEPAKWHPVLRRLRDEALVKKALLMCQAAHAQGMQPADLEALLQFYLDHRSAWGSPGAIRDAIDNWTPGDKLTLKLWPTPEKGYDPEAKRRMEEDLAAKAAAAELAAQHEREIAQQEAVLEADYGSILDAMTYAEISVLLDGQNEWTKTYCLQQLRRGGVSHGSARLILLKLLADRKSC